MTPEQKPAESPLKYSDDDPDCYVSIWQWMWTQLLVVVLVMIPVVGWIGLLILAFTGNNLTWKNYFRATLIKIFVLILAVGVIALVEWPAIQKKIQENHPAHQKAR